VKRILFACVHNAGRSQMAAAWFNALSDPVLARAESAGTAPGDAVHPEVVEAMREVGIDLTGARPRRLDEALLAGVSWLITMGCGEACPLPPAGVQLIDWPLEDPRGQSLEAVRRIRDQIRAHVEALLVREGWTRP
jgi:arsenate reductase